ncbi:hypothetical protein vBPpSSYP_113 [Pseudomonas phage vB_PpS_SYP]|nr:hypothetical protein vBPpSSYP_113 [Pseudomonas phage vB_PpS_SYP]
MLSTPLDKIRFDLYSWQLDSDTKLSRPDREMSKALTGSGLKARRGKIIGQPESELVTGDRTGNGKDKQSYTAQAVLLPHVA